MIVIAGISLNHDFTSGVARLLYALRKKRSKILASKYLGYVSAIGIFAILFTFMIVMVGIPYKIKFSQILVIDVSNVYLVNSNAYIAICIASLISLTIFFSTIIFSISMFMRGIYASVFVNILFIVFYLILAQTSSGWFSSFFVEFMSYYLLSVNFGVFIIIYIIRLILAALFFLLARRRFLKRDIY
jgi:ABC-type transport system involved in multi-copper enzyme maturation permease subunit